MEEATTAITPEAPESWPVAMNSRLETMMAISSYRPTNTTRRLAPCRPVARAGVAVTGETDEAEEEAERELADAIAETGFDMLRSVCFEN
ncbi:hypothetical protein CT3_00950 [Comamonas terrigena NBRC 13299]|nr:hypothetical protein CT3_00950 [Comamonas terrigena NBRC 13299]